MTQSTDWPSILAPSVPWRECYQDVETYAWAVLYSHTDRTLTTSELMVLLWPEARQGGKATAAERSRLASAFMALAKHSMADCVTRGEAVLRFKSRKNPNGILVRPYLWRAPM